MQVPGVFTDAVVVSATRVSGYRPSRAGLSRDVVLPLRRGAGLCADRILERGCGGCAADRVTAGLSQNY